MTMKHIFKIKLCVCLFLLSVASCTEKKIFGDMPQDGDLVEMTFILNIAQTQEVDMSRATADENTINNIHLMVFPSQEPDAILEQTQELNPSDMTDAGNESGYRKKFTTTLKASSTPKYIFVVANAANQLSGIKTGETTLEDIRNKTTNCSENPYVMSGVIYSTIPGIGLIAEDIPLIRTVAKITVQTGGNVNNFSLDGFELRNGNSTGSILAGADQTVPTTAGTETLSATKNGPLYTCPGSHTSSGHFLIIKGTYNGTEGYYRINLRTQDSEGIDILPNHHYEIMITEVTTHGYATADEAAESNQTGITATIYDHQPDINNMITDGNVELGVSDTIEIGAQTNSTQTFKIKYYPGTPTDLKVELDSKDTYWLALDNNGNPISETNLNDGKETGTLYEYRVKVISGNLSGDSRYATIHLSAGNLSRDVIVKQTNEFINDEFGSISLKVIEYDRDENTWAAKLKKEYDPYDNYWKFIRGEETDPTKILYGINPEDMGGKIRNEGFHAPMSDFMQFVYTFTMPDESNNADYNNVSWKVELAEGYEDKLLFWDGIYPPEGQGTSTPPRGDNLAGQSFTFTNKLLDLQKPDASIISDAYRYGKDVFRIVLTNKNTGRTTTLSYDLYHTGVFAYDDGKGTYQTGNANSQGWYYYEVILMGNNYWLDRNLGAKSSGYYIQDENGNSLLGNGSWPFDDKSAGGLYCIAGFPNNNEPNIIDDICPKGFRVPYMSEFNALVSNPNFKNEYIVNTGLNYWSSHYISDKGTVFFPKNRMYYDDTQTAGDANAGYYWTRTAAVGTSGSERGFWLQFMKFSGSNASAGRYRIFQGNDPNLRRNGMSVRCVYASRTVETSYDIEFYVKGYTHVFLYNDEGNGKMTYLNSWPGEMIAIYDNNSLNMYHTFTYNSVTEYNNLKVVFNVVDNDGSIISSYPADYAVNGGIRFSRTQNEKFFRNGAWSSTAN